MKQRIKKFLSAGSSILCCILFPCVAYAGTKEDSIVKDIDSKVSFISELFLTGIQGVGGIVFGFGIVSLSSAISSRNSTELTESLLKTVGGLLMLIVPGIVKLYT